MLLNTYYKKATAATLLLFIFSCGKSQLTPEQLTNVNGTLFFAAQNSSAGRELSKSDGTTGGTVLVKDFFKGTGGSNPKLTNVDGTLYFVANDGINPVKNFIIPAALQIQ